MKKHIFTLLLSVISMAAFAQFNQGTKMVGGTVSFSSTTTKGKWDNTTRKLETTTNFSMAPQFGYFVIDRLALGAALDFSLSNYKSKTDEEDVSYTTIQIAPFVRYYLPAGVFFEGQFGVGTSKASGKNWNGATVEGKENIFSWSLAAGYAIMINESVAIEPMLGYGSINYANPDADNDYRQLNPGIFLQVGFQIYLP
jgi:hypothetical protein